MAFIAASTSTPNHEITATLTARVHLSVNPLVSYFRLNVSLTINTWWQYTRNPFIWVLYCIRACPISSSASPAT